MFGIGTEELLLILVIALVVLGPERMPKLARDLGRMVGEFRKTSDDLRNEFLNADSIIDVAARSASTPAVIPPAENALPVAVAAGGAPAVEAAPATPVDIGVPLDAESLLGPGMAEPLTEAAVASAPTDEAGAPMPAAVSTGSGDMIDPADPDETLFDKEAREAHERLRDPARARQAAAEGWKTPTDDAGTTDRWG